MKKILTAITIILLITTAGYSSVVDIMIGSRGAGLGGAYAALVNDPSAAYWNPAGLAMVENISIMESNWILADVEGLNVNYVTASLPIKNVGTVSGSWLLRHATLEQWEGDDIVSQTGNEHSFTLSMARKLWDELAIFKNTSLGFSLNRHVFKSDEIDGAGLGFDVGIQTGLPVGFSFAFVARSLGSETMDKKNDPELRWGLGMEQTLKDMHRITLGIDASLKLNRDYESQSKLEGAQRNLKGYGGLEYAVLLEDLEIGVRGGFNASRYSSLDSYGFSVGAGLKYKTYSIQYAFLGGTDREAALGIGHRISLIVGFNKILNED